MPFCHDYVLIWAWLQHFPVALVFLWQDHELFVTDKNQETAEQLRARNNVLEGVELTGTHCMCQDSPQIARHCELSKTETRPCTDGLPAETHSQHCVRRTQRDSKTAKCARGFSPPVRGVTVAFQASCCSVSFFFSHSSFWKVWARVDTSEAENQSGGGLKTVFFPFKISLVFPDSD